MIANMVCAAIVAVTSPEDLEGALQALLEAAAAQDDAQTFAQTVQLLALTQPTDRIVAGAHTISPEHGDRARTLLGPSPLQTRVMPAPAVTPLAAPREDMPVVVAETEPHPEPVEPAPIWRRTPVHIITLLGQTQSDLWTGRAQLGMRSDSGDSERLDYTLGLEAKRQLEGWGFEASTLYSYSMTNNKVGRDELIAKARGEREAGEHWTLFVNTEWERDQLSGFDWTGFFGAGAGYRAVQNPSTKLTLRAAPCVRHLREADNGNRTEGAFDLLSDLELKLNNSMQLESETRILAANNTRADQLFKLQTDLGELWSLEVRYRYRHEFDPEPGFNAGDNRTDLSLVREF